MQEIVTTVDKCAKVEKRFVQASFQPEIAHKKTKASSSIVSGMVVPRFTPRDENSNKFHHFCQKSRQKSAERTPNVFAKTPNEKEVNFQFPML